MSTFIAILLACSFLSLISFVGAFFLLQGKILTSRFSNIMVSFAAGTMLATAFVDLLPEALEEIKTADIFSPVFGGMIMFFILERFVLWYHHHDSSHNIKPASYLVLLGDGVHNVIDGVSIAAAFLINPNVGIVTTIAIAAHEIPQEIADFSILVAGGMSRKRALFFNFLSSLPAIVGALLAYFFLEGIHSVIPYLISFTAGMFIYIASSDLIPEMHKESDKQGNWIHVLPFITGIGIIYALVTILE